MNLLRPYKTSTTIATISYAGVTGTAKFVSIERDGQVLLVLDREDSKLQTPRLFHPNQSKIVPGLPEVSDWDYHGPPVPVDDYIHLDEARRGFLVLD